MFTVSPLVGGNWKAASLLYCYILLHTVTAQRKGGVDVFPLTNFDVQIALQGSSPTGSNTGVSTVDLIQAHEVTNIVTEWMTESFREQLSELGYVDTYADFDRVFLIEREVARHLMEEDDEEDEQEVVPLEVYHARYQGQALFARSFNQTSVPDETVEAIQLATLADEVPLFEALTESNARGLGPLVKDVRAFVASNGGKDGDTDSSSESDDGKDEMEIVIIIAIAVACVAFVFLLFAIFWAWRYEKRNRDAYLVQGRNQSRREKRSSSNTNKVDKTDVSYDGESEHDHSPVQNVQIKQKISTDSGEDDGLPGGLIYPDAIVNNDITTSLSQYYQKGGRPAGADESLASNEKYSGLSSMMNDAASISSMESYGYSLDGYTLGTPMTQDMYPTNKQQLYPGNNSNSRLGAAGRLADAENADIDLEEPVQRREGGGIGRLAEDETEEPLNDEPAEQSSA